MREIKYKSKYTVKYKRIKYEEMEVAFEWWQSPSLSDLNQVRSPHGLNLFVDDEVTTIPWAQLEWAKVKEESFGESCIKYPNRPECP